LSAAIETLDHVMATPASEGETLFDLVDSHYLDERELIKLAFAEEYSSGSDFLDNTGQSLPSQTVTISPMGFDGLTSNPTQVTAYGLGAGGNTNGILPGLYVPNTEPTGSYAGYNFDVHAVDVLGTIKTAGQSDFYSLAGHANDVINLSVMSRSLERITKPIDAYVRVYDSSGNVIATYGGPGATNSPAINDDEFESSDAAIVDLILPSDGTYTIQVTSYTGPGADVNYETGDYELFLYRFAAYLPNYVSGPVGFGPEAFVPNQAAVPYRVHFENVSTAAAPVQAVKITQQLDSNLDWTTFQLGNVGFGSFTVPAPGGQSFHTRIDARASLGLFVDVDAEFNALTGLATWTFTAIDPGTLQQPTDPLTGFLPPDDATGRGEGFVTYSVQPKAGVTTGTVLNAKAPVVFGANLELDTPLAFNTIDALPPTSHATALPPVTVSTGAFTVSWSGSDDPGGSGIATYDIYVSDKGGPFAPFVLGTAQTSATFMGVPGHTYGFYSVATDNVGHREATPMQAQAFTLVLAPTTIKIATVVVPYDGQPHSTTAEVFGPGDVDVGPATITYSRSDRVDVGTYGLMATFAGTGYYAPSSATSDSAVTITQVTPTIDVTPVNVTYDGQPHGTTAEVHGVGNVDLGPAAISDTPPIDAGVHSVTATFAGNHNYTSTSVTIAAITIKNAGSTTTTVGDGPFTYDGTPHAGGSGTVIGAGGLSTTATSLTYSANSDGTGMADLIDAGTYYVTAHYAGDANHDGSDGAAVAIVIKKASSTTTTVGDGPFTYDGTPHAGGSGTVTGAGELNTTATSLTYSGDQVDAGTYYVTAHYAGDANHDGSDGAAVAITIKKATSSTTTVGDVPFTYDGTTHTGGSGTVTGAGSLSTTATSLTYSGDQVDAGTYYVTAHYAGDANHDGSDGAAVGITIKQATPTFIWTPVYVTHDGQPHGITAEVQGVTDLGPATIAYSSGTVPVDVGVYNATLSFAGTTDYAAVSSTFSPAVTITAPASNAGGKQFVVVINDPNTPNSEVVIADGLPVGATVVGPGGVTMVTTAVSAVSVPGMIMYMQPVGVFSYQMTIAMSSPMLTGDALFVDTFATSGGAGTLNVMASASGYLPTDMETPGLVSPVLGGVTRGTVSFQEFVDPNNAPFNITRTAETPGLQGPFSGAFGDSRLMAVNDLTGAFAITKVLNIVHQGASITGVGAWGVIQSMLAAQPDLRANVQNALDAHGLYEPGLVLPGSAPVQSGLVPLTLDAGLPAAAGGPSLNFGTNPASPRGADILVGGAGNDVLIGGQGRDLLIGGFGTDGSPANSPKAPPLVQQDSGAAKDTAFGTVMAQWASHESAATATAGDGWGDVLASADPLAVELLFAQGF
jgi:hypothetical protein